MRSIIVTGMLLVMSMFAHSEEAGRERGKMTLDHMGEIVQRIAPDAKRQNGSWRFNIEGYQVSIFTDVKADRMRIIVPVESVENISSERLYRLMQANFDSALDVRYSIAQKILWSAFIHPLGSLGDEEFISGLGQAINLAETYGTVYSSGALVFGGGDSQDLRRRELIDRLLRKGLAI